MLPVTLFRALILSASAFAYPIDLLNDDRSSIPTHELVARAPAKLQPEPLQFVTVPARGSSRNMPKDPLAPNEYSKKAFVDLFKLAAQKYDKDGNIIQTPGERGKVIGIKLLRAVREGRPIVVGTKEDGTEKIVYGSSSGEWIPFENTRRTMRVTGMHGCSLAVVLTRKGVWAGHFWEDESTPGKGGCFLEATEGTGRPTDLKKDYELDEDTGAILKDKNGKPIPKTIYDKQNRDPSESYVLMDNEVKKLSTEKQHEGWMSLADVLEQKGFSSGDYMAMILTKADGIKNPKPPAKNDGGVTVSQDGLPTDAPKYPKQIESLRNTFGAMCDKGKCLRDAHILQIDPEYPACDARGEDDDGLADLMGKVKISDKPGDKVKVVTYIGEAHQSLLPTEVNGVTIIDYSPHHRNGDKGKPWAGVNVWVEARPKPEINMEWAALKHQLRKSVKRRGITAAKGPVSNPPSGPSHGACRAGKPKSNAAGQTQPKPGPGTKPAAGTTTPGTGARGGPTGPAAKDRAAPGPQSPASVGKPVAGKGNQASSKPASAGQAAPGAVTQPNVDLAGKSKGTVKAAAVSR